jgi:hypothetical protein
MGHGGPFLNLNPPIRPNLNPEGERRMSTQTTDHVIPATTPPIPAPMPTLAGYTEGAPPWLTDDSIVTDKRCVAALRCPSCGCRRMAYHPYYRMIPRSYRALADCPCGHSEEM